eukprot:366525-Chlamydomonas_euryale.AAC.7
MPVSLNTGNARHCMCMLASHHDGTHAWMHARECACMSIRSVSNRQLPPYICAQPPPCMCAGRSPRRPVTCSQLAQAGGQPSAAAIAASLQGSRPGTAQLLERPATTSHLQMRGSPRVEGASSPRGTPQGQTWVRSPQAGGGSGGALVCSSPQSTGGVRHSTRPATASAPPAEPRLTAGAPAQSPAPLSARLMNTAQRGTGNLPGTCGNGPSAAEPASASSAAAPASALVAHACQGPKAAGAFPDLLAATRKAGAAGMGEWDLQPQQGTAAADAQVSSRVEEVPRMFMYVYKCAREFVCLCTHDEAPCDAV